VVGIAPIVTPRRAAQTGLAPVLPAGRGAPRERRHGAGAWMLTIRISWRGNDVFVCVEPLDGQSRTYAGSAWVGEPPGKKFLDAQGDPRWVIHADSQIEAMVIVENQIRTGVVKLEA